MTIKSKSDSVRKKLSNLALKLEVPYRNLETAFLIERLVARLVADKKLDQHLVFKGGFVLLKRYESLRYTRDADVFAVSISKAELVTMLKNALLADLDDGFWYGDIQEQELNDQGEYGVFKD